MNNDLATIMADCETPYAVIPTEMVGLDREVGSAFDQLDQLLEINTILKPQKIAVIPSALDGVDGLFAVRFDQPLSEEHMVVFEMFVRPIADQTILERIGAAELASLLPEKV